MNLLKQRRTIRKFHQRPIDKKTLLEFVDCARLAPSAGNLQPLKYIVECSSERNAKIFPLTKWAAYLKGAGTPSPDEAPTAYIVILNDTTVGSAHFALDAGAAAMSIITVAENEGLSSCWIASVDKAALADLYSLPDTMQIVSVIALGYAAERSQTVNFEGDVKYFRNPDGSLSVPKRSLEDVLLYPHL